MFIVAIVAGAAFMVGAGTGVVIANRSASCRVCGGAHRRGDDLTCERLYLARKTIIQMER